MWVEVIQWVLINICWISIVANSLCIILLCRARMGLLKEWEKLRELTSELEELTQGLTKTE